MPVLLDNIQFYNGPSKPAKPPYFAFDSKKDSKDSNTLLSSEQLAFSNEPVSSATDDSTIVPTDFLPPAANAEEYTTHQHAVGSPTLFDLELARFWGASPLLATLEASGSDTCPSLRKLGCHCRDKSDEQMPDDSPSSFGANLSRNPDLDSSDVFPRSQPSYTSPPQPRQPPSTAVLSPDPAISHPDITQLHVVEDVQWRRNQPSDSTYFESLNPTHAWDTSDVSTAFIEHSSHTPLSSLSSCSDVVCIPSLEPEDCPDDRSDDYAEASQARLISDCSPRTVAKPGPFRPAGLLHVNVPNSMDLEQADGRESGNSRSRTPSVQSDSNLVLPNPRERKKKECPMRRTRKRDTTRNECYPSVAVVIPPPRPRPVRTLPSRPKPVALDAYEIESSEDVDDSSDEDFTTDTIPAELLNAENSVEENHGPPSPTAPCYPNDTSFGSSTSYYESRDIVGRAILTIETQGSEPTFFFTLMPDNFPSISYVAAPNPPHNSEKAGGVLKPSTSISRPTRGKNKRRTYSTDENNLLVKLKEERKLTWKEITDYFPGRASTSLQVHYSTKLRHLRAKRSRPQSRRGKKK
ncbi:uncharacterized protein N7458_004300 [Penicillium daleae]|uniref:Myb-like domain-containing protein n=1 Tax=Penicillium daleae TaxID=63821 RepID=A0AAD6G4V1_9EURO|nr:uncharacterized protein N7458_004300 [Penicillium daleae]KAJ5456036.1 hypothetical protein N7458_004300 [Penicillium daleae]